MKNYNNKTHSVSAISVAKTDADADAAAVLSNHLSTEFTIYIGVLAWVPTSQCLAE